MSTAGMIKVSAGCPTFDGTDYPYWKNKMRMHLEAIDNDLQYIVENGVPSVTPTVTTADVKRFKQLDSQAKNIICGHLSKGQYGRVSALETAKLAFLFSAFFSAALDFFTSDVEGRLIVFTFDDLSDSAEGEGGTIFQA